MNINDVDTTQQYLHRVDLVTTHLWCMWLWWRHSCACSPDNMCNLQSHPVLTVVPNRHSTDSHVNLVD